MVDLKESSNLNIRVKSYRDQLMEYRNTLQD